VAPVHFRVDTSAWTANAGHVPIHPVNCAPMVRIRRMGSNAQCHMCGRCSDHLDAVALAARSPEREVVNLRVESASTHDAVLIVFGLLGIAIGAFHWNVSPWFIELKLYLAGVIVDHGPAWLLSSDVPWWLLTHYPEANDTFTVLDGAPIVLYIAATALVLGGLVTAALLAAATAWKDRRLERAQRLAYALIPLAGLGVFLGLSGLTVTLMHHEGIGTAWVFAVRLAVVALGAAWSIRLAWRQAADLVSWRRVASTAAFTMAVGVVVASWILVYGVWA